MMKHEKTSHTTIEKAKEIILAQGGIIRTHEAIQEGIHPRTLYRLRDGNELEQIFLGVYHLSENGPVSNPDLVTVANASPNVLSA